MDQGVNVVISFRYHLVSIAAVFLALAAGVALGAGPLSDSTKIIGDDSSNVSAEVSALQSFESSYAQQTGPSLVSGELKGTSVVFFVLPGARTDQVKALSAAFSEAGASVEGQIALKSQLIDSKGRQFAEGVALQSTKGVDGVTNSSESYQRIGSALARAYLADKTTKIDSDASTITSAFTEGALIEVIDKPAKRAELAVIVAGGDEADSDVGQGDIVAAMADAFDQTAKGTLLVGPTASSSDGGYVDVLRSSDASSRVSTFDVLNSAAGQLVATLVAAREITGESGHFGTERSADGAIPK